MSPATRSLLTIEPGLSPLTAAFDRAVTLAHNLADLSHRTGEADFARLTTDALAIAQDVHAVSELLATIAGVPEPGP